MALITSASIPDSVNDALDLVAQIETYVRDRIPLAACGFDAGQVLERTEQLRNALCVLGRNHGL